MARMTVSGSEFWGVGVTKILLQSMGGRGQSEFHNLVLSGCPPQDPICHSTRANEA